MKNNTLILLATTLFICSYAQENPKQYPFGVPGSESRGVFGEDNRKEVKDAEGFQEFARATAVMIPKSSVSGNKIYSYTLSEMLYLTFGVDKFHENIKFLDQPTAGTCTGFLIAPDVLVTAGHCIKTIEDANEYIFLFDYTTALVFDSATNSFTFDEENAFEVSEVLSSELSDDDVSRDELLDYAVLKLDRKSDRAPYRFRTSGSVGKNTSIYAMGAPTGLPLKFSEKAVVVDDEPKKWFKSSIDAFPGNSGGPVFDQNGFIEGILVRGAVEFANGRYTGDYKYDHECECIKTVYFESADYTAGCQTHRITEIPGEILIESVYLNQKYAIENNLHDRFENWDDYSWGFLEEHLNGRTRLEDIAIEAKNYKALSRILEYTIDDLSNTKKRQYLDTALEYNDIDLLTTLLDKEIFPDAGIAGKTLLLQSVKANNLNFAKTLIEYEANTNVKDHYGNTLLHISAAKGNRKMVELLIANGLKPNTKNHKKYYPEKIAKKRGHKSLAKYLKRIRKRK